MRLMRIELAGYRGVRPDRRLVLDNLAHRNVFVGPNNAGKSAIFRFIQTIRSQIKRTDFNLRNAQRVPFDANWWWQQRAEHPIEALLYFRGLPSDVTLRNTKPGRLILNEEWRIEVGVYPDADGTCLLSIVPQVAFGDAFRPLSKREGRGLVHLNEQGEYVSTAAEDACPYHEPAMALLRAWAERLIFFDPIRALDRSPGKRKMEDGSALLGELWDWQQDKKRAPTFQAFRRDLVKTLNELLVEPNGMASIESFEVKGSREENDLDLFVSFRDDGMSIPLEHMGTGIAELLVLFAFLRRSQFVDSHIFLEEPETHLHPGLMRRIMDRIGMISKAQFFISTHSSVIVDGLGSGDAVFHFVTKLNEGCLVRCCDSIVTKHGLLDDLGISASSLFQANCILWVEGPSDRLYVKAWLAGVDSLLVEGSDYAFAYYGGKVLSGFTLMGEPDDLISLIRISRFAAILMDKDVGPGEEESIRGTKRRIVDEAAADRVHRLACFSEGREIENDVSEAALGAAIQAILPSHSVKEFVAAGKQPYENEVVEYLGLKDEEARRVKRKLGKKVELARAAIASGRICDKIPSYITPLVEFIRASRVL